MIEFAVCCGSSQSFWRKCGRLEDLDNLICGHGSEFEFVGHSVCGLDFLGV